MASWCRPTCWLTHSHTHTLTRRFILSSAIDHLSAVTETFEEDPQREWEDGQGVTTHRTTAVAITSHCPHTRSHRRDQSHADADRGRCDHTPTPPPDTNAHTPLPHSIVSCAQATSKTCTGGFASRWSQLVLGRICT